ncbi:MAG: protein kinase, partial [Candidatus Omnitrophica bacterium]|nr:protein kinase [Candidatus Omnitrophota bacterium]
MVHSAFDDARAVLKDRDFPDSAELVWSNHGPYRLADLDDPLWICEMGEKGSAPLLAPVESAEARRLTLPDEEPVLGWRPSLEKSLPNAPDWVLTEKLGEGGFGEVWRIQNRANNERRVAKFCFQSERVRHLKREVSLIRLLRERIGKHPNIVQLHEVCFETPPYYIVMEDVAGKDLAKWFEEHRDHPKLTEQVRLEIVARVADTLQSAHDAGVIHRDVKPSNILIKGTLDSDSGITVMLTDFGIGQAPGREIPSGSTLTGFTGTFSPTELRARSGSWLYMAPEVLVGQESSIRSDVYSLGVILYQIVHGEFNQPLPADWERGIKDPILAGDIRRCLARRPEDRYESAGEFARALRNLGERRIAQAIEETRRRTEARRRRLTFGLGVFSVFAMALTIALGSAWRVAVQARERERLARLEAERGHYHSQIHEAQRAIEDHDSWSAREILYKCPEHLRGWEWGRLAYLSNLEQRVFGFEDTEVYCMAQSRDGSTLACGGMDGRVRVWELRSGNLLWEFKAGEGRVIQLALDSDSTTLAVSDEAWVSIWDVNSHRRTGQFRAERPPVVELQFLPDRSLLASADSHECFCIRDLSKPGRPAMELGDVGQLRDLAITPDGSRMFAACHDHGLMIFNGQTFALEKALGEEGQLATSVTVDNAGGAFAVAFENRIRLGSVPSLDLSGAELRVPGPVESLCFFRDGRLLAYQTSMGSYGVIDLESRAERYTGRGAIGKTILISPLDNRVVVLGRDRRVREYRHDRDLDGIPLEGHQAFVSAYDFSSDGEMLATGSDDQTIRLWDTESGRNISTFISPRPIRCLAFLSENQRIVGGSPGGAVQQWDTITGQLIKEIQTGASNITSICRHPAKDRFAISTSEGQVVVYERSTLEKVLTIVASNGPVSRVAFSPDGSRLATAGEDYLVKEWDSETGNLVRVFEAHTSPVNQVAFLADGERLASAGEDQRILIWNRETGECVGTMLDKEYSLFDLAVSPDSQRLFTRARLWDLNNFRPILDFGERHRILHRDGLLMVEGGVPTALRILPAFPWKDHDLSEDPTLSLEERVEEYRGRYWQARGAPSK